VWTASGLEFVLHDFETVPKDQQVAARRTVRVIVRISPHVAYINEL
jgi:hypothetical protein